MVGATSVMVGREVVMVGATPVMVGVIRARAPTGRRTVVTRRTHAAVSYPVGARRGSATLPDAMPELVEDEATDIEAAWEAEIGRRVEEMERGEDEGVPAEEVFARFGLTF